MTSNQNEDLPSDAEVGEALWSIYDTYVWDVQGEVVSLEQEVADAMDAQAGEALESHAATADEVEKWMDVTGAYSWTPVIEGEQATKNWFTDKVWDTSKDEAWLEQKIKEFLDRLRGEGEDKVGPLPGLLTGALDDVTKPVREGLKSVYNDVTNILYEISLEFESLFDLFAEWASARLEDLLTIPAMAFYRLLNLILPEVE